MAVLNSNPEILLKKRKNADRKRLEKQEEIANKIKKSKQLKLKQKQKNFKRAETLLSNQKSNELEKKRINKINQKLKKEASSLKDTSADDEYKLLFVIRIPNHTKGLKIPKKAYQILQVLKLTESNTGVFVKANQQTIQLLGLIAPYIIIGQPSLSSIRKLFQKRARITTIEEPEEEEDSTTQQEEPKEKIIKLDNNQLVEDKFEKIGLICIEDLIHEITTLSDNFLKITNWLLPFKLNPPINGWGPQSKLARLIYDNENKVEISLAQDFKLKEIDDIDSVIDQQN
ncbi:RLP7 [Candida pseudojiufengensis]|uniref:RLP7 n=1 Tax=Candida pseudojiufengensis TaxID=497109 RepID=UPI0022255F8F|nr:RLP7 [Candida pseudojiufengensis]KAI5962549.1 RLP7 [Candida pseudojiufengensis]